MDSTFAESKKFNVRIVHSVRDNFTGIEGDVRKSQKFMMMYKLQGNESLNHLKKYQDLMNRYSRLFSGDRIVKKVKKEIQDRHLFKDFCLPSPINPAQLRTYRLSYSPEPHNKSGYKNYRKKYY